MSQQVDMNIFLHSLLVIKEMDDFTVMEARDVLLAEHAEFTDSTEARKFIYRQLLRNINKGLLKRTDHNDGKAKRVIYSKTDLFFASTITPVTRENKTLPVSETTATQEKHDLNALLENQLMAYEVDLNASLEEVKEYTRLSRRFPKLKKKLQGHQRQAKNQSVQLLGKVHALQKVLGYSTTGYQAC